MQDNNKQDESQTLELSADEFYMIFTATGGPVFIGTTNRKIAAFLDLSKEDVLAFEQRIIDDYKRSEKKGIQYTLSISEIKYLLKIHKENMHELDPIEYPTIIGHSYSNAKKLRRKLEELSK
jgi:hypothetical protein